MAYNPYNAVNAIYKFKEQWNSANNAGDTAKKNDAAAKAQAYYNQLRKSGYGDVADELAASNYTQAKSINDKWAKMDKTPTRQHLYTLGQKYGMSTSDVDKIISWDNDTGQVSLGGKVVGTPDAVVDGVSYWADTSKLDNAFNDYVSRSGTVRSKSAAVDQENENLFAKYRQEYDDLKNTNPFTTEEAKSILSKYDLAGLQGRDNAVASNAGSNSGNIDSFAAANALRQQSALVNQGQQVVLDAYQRKLDHARNLLSDMGVNIDRVYNQDETSKNNETARLSEQAAVSGYTPTQWSIQNDSFLRNFVDENGKLKSEYNDTDFQELINNAKASGNTELANKYAILRGLKIFGNFSEYGKYLNQGDVSYIQPQRTSEYDLTKQQIESAENIAKGENSTSLALADKENSTSLALADKEAASALAQINAQTQGEKELIRERAKTGTTKPTITAAQAITAIKNGEKSQPVIDAYNYYYGTNYTTSNPPKISGGSGSKTPDLLNGGTKNNENNGGTKNNGGTAKMTDSQVKAWADKLNNAITEKYGSNFTAVESIGNGNYKRGNADADYIIIRVLESDELTTAQKEYLLIDKFGITEDQINTVMKDPHYR